MIRFRFWIACVVSSLSACGGPDESPETRIRSLISEVEEAAEVRDISVISDVVSDEYRDGRGYDRQAVLRIVQGIFLRNREIHLLSVVRELQVNASSGRARVLVAMAGQPIKSADALIKVRAELIRFDVDFALEGEEWFVRAVEWQRANVKDFL